MALPWPLEAVDEREQGGLSVDGPRGVLEAWVEEARLFEEGMSLELSRKAAAGV